MTHDVLLVPKAAKALEKLKHTTRRRIIEALQQLRERPDLGKPLHPSYFWSLRIGDYRAIYEIDSENKRIIGSFIGHKKNVYDNFSKLF